MSGTAPRQHRSVPGASGTPRGTGDAAGYEYGYNAAMSKRAPLIVAIVLLLLPMLYVGSYLVLVWPDGERLNFADSRSDFPTYRCETESWARRVYWPLEQVDRKIRPNAWSDGFERIGVDFN